jgi:hypothetical protein
VEDSSLVGMALSPKTYRIFFPAIFSCQVSFFIKKGKVGHFPTGRSFVEGMRCAEEKTDANEYKEYL